MEIIDTFRKALKLQIHTLPFIFPTKKFKTLWLSRNCLSALQFSFRHTFPHPQLWRVFFPAPNKETGSHGRDFAVQISCSLGGSEGSQGLTQARHTLRCLFTAWPVKKAHPSPGLAGPGRMHLMDAASSTQSGLFPRAGRKLGVELQAVPPQSPSLDTGGHAFCCDFADCAEQPDIKAPWDPSNFPGTKRVHPVLTGSGPSPLSPRSHMAWGMLGAGVRW